LQWEALLPDDAGVRSDVESDDGSIFDSDTDGLGTMQISDLCFKCQNMFNQWHNVANLNHDTGYIKYEEVAFFPHYDSVLALENSAMKGCASCAQFLQTGDATPFNW
jgi:hypothetical protein